MGIYQGAVPGACLAVLQAGTPVLRRAYGLADVDARVAATPATNFRLASITKQFTAAAILLLAEDGQLSIDAPVARWLPGLPGAAHITVRQLLTHTSGVMDYEDLIPSAQTAQLRDADVLQLLEAHSRRYFPPGAAFRYSNSGYVLLGLIVGRAAGEGFAAFLQRRIFGPLRMRNTLAYEAGMAEIAHRAFGHRCVSEDGAGHGHDGATRAGTAAPLWTRADQSLTSATLGDGGIYSSIDDLARWDAALYDSRLLRAASLRAAFSPLVATSDPAVHYGFGWRVSGAALWHSGETTGFRNVILRYPERRLSVILLTNRDAPEPYATARAIAELCGPSPH